MLDVEFIEVEGMKYEVGKINNQRLKTRDSFIIKIRNAKLTGF